MAAASPDENDIPPILRALSLFAAGQKVSTRLFSSTTFFTPRTPETEHIPVARGDPSTWPKTLWSALKNRKEELAYALTESIRTTDRGVEPFINSLAPCFLMAVGLGYQGTVGLMLDMGVSDFLSVPIDTSAKKAELSELRSSLFTFVELGLSVRDAVYDPVEMRSSISILQDRGGISDFQLPLGLQALLISSAKSNESMTRLLISRGALPRRQLPLRREGDNNYSSVRARIFQACNKSFPKTARMCLI